METQSALMGSAAAAVILIALLWQTRSRRALVFAALIAGFAIACAARGAQALGLAAGDALLPWAGLAVGGLAPVAAATLGRQHTHLRRGIPLLAAATAGFGALLWFWPWSPALAVRAVTLWATLGSGLGALCLARAIPDTPHPSELTRLRYLAVTHAGALGAIAIDAAAARAGLPRVATSLAPLLYLYTGYLHLTQTRVADLRQIAGDAIALTLVAMGLAGLFAAIRIWTGDRLDLFVFNAFVASFALLPAFPPLRATVQGVIDRLFIADRLELERSLQPLVDGLQQTATLDELLRLLLATVDRTERLRSCSLFLRNDADLGYQQAGSLGLPPRSRVGLLRHPAWVEAMESSPALVASEVEKELATGTVESEHAELELVLRTMEGLDAQLVLPLRAGERCVGFWTLADARFAESFSSGEIRLLRGIADRIAESIENSRSFERIRARDQLVALGEMAGGLAHEIRNPLAAIRGALSILEDADASEREDFQQVVVDEIHRLDRVVESFLDYARPARGRPEPFDPGPRTRRSAETVARVAGRPEVRLRVEIAEALPEIDTDPSQLERVVMNLVHNAYQALPGAGSVSLELRSVPGNDSLAAAVELSVADDGPGMDESTRERAFVPFFSTRASGTGLGLALCERIVRGWGGTVELDSAPGKGTRVVVRIPAHAVPSAAPEGEAE